MNLTKYVWPTQRPLSFITRRNNHQVHINYVIIEIVICLNMQCLVMHMSVTDLHSLEYFAYVLSHELVDFNLEFEYTHYVLRATL